MNRATLMGRVGRNPESRFTASGTQVVSFSLATTERFTDKQGQKQEKTEWHNLILWAKTAEIAEKFVHKGDQVLIEGKIQNRSYDDRDGNKKYISEIVVSNLHLLSNPRQQSNQTPAQPQSQGYQNQKNPTYGEPGPREAARQQGQPPIADETWDIPF